MKNIKRFNKKETRQFIEIQYPAIKGELQQANSKINMFITVFGIFLTAMASLLCFSIGEYIKDRDIYWIIVVAITSVFSILCFAKITYLLFVLKPAKKVPKRKDKMTITDPFYFFNYQFISEEQFIAHFTVDNHVELCALKQIYVIGNLCIIRYGAAKIFI